MTDSISFAKLIDKDVDWLDYLAQEKLALDSSGNPVGDGMTLQFSFYDGGVLPFYVNNQKYPQVEGSSLAGAAGEINTLQESLIRFFLLPQASGYRVSFSDVSNLKFSESEGLGEIHITNLNIVKPTALGGALQVDPDATGYDTWNQTWAGDIFLDTDGSVDNVSSHANVNQRQTGLAQKGYHVILHELAHAIGLQHSDRSIDGEYSSLKYTIMIPSISKSMGYLHPEMGITTFNNVKQYVFAQGLQLLDIAAIQSIYGRNYATRGVTDETDPNSGNTVYGLGQGFANESTPFIYTIWDGGGLHDSISGAGYLSGVQIDLRQGHFSSIVRQPLFWSPGSSGTIPRLIFTHFLDHLPRENPASVGIAG